MKILMLHSSSGLYGASKILITTAKELKKQGHAILVVVSENGPLVGELEAEGIETLVIQLGIIRRKYFSAAGIINRAWVLTKSFRALRKIIHQQKTDLIYSNTTGVLIGAVIARVYGIRHIWHVHETIMKPVFICKLIGQLMDRCTDRIITVSNGVREHWTPFVRNRSKFVRIYNGIDTAPFADKHSTLRQETGAGPDTLLVGMIGMVHFIKGHDYFLRIAGRLAKIHPAIKFVIVGDVYPGYEYLAENLHRIANEEHISDNIYYTGFRKDIVNVLNGLDIVVLPSVLPDSFPTVILEAMAAEKPVVATKLGGALEMIIPDHTGILIPVNDAEEASSLIKPLLLNAERRQMMGKEGRKRLEQEFSLETFHQQISAYIN